MMADTLSSIEIDTRIERLVTASKQPARSRTQPVQALVTDITSHAYENGLSPVQLEKLVGLVSRSSQLDQANVTTLVKGLYPANLVPASVVLTAVSGIGFGEEKPSLNTQALILNWLSLVRECLEDEVSLIKCYGVLFNGLGTLGTRKPLCQLLSSMTKRKHVKPWRIQMVLHHLQSSPLDASLVGLLRVYKEFYPDIVVDQPLSVKPTLFKHPDIEWRDRLRAIQDRQVSAGTGPAQSDSFHVFRKGVKRARATVPEVHTFRVDGGAVSLEEISGVENFVEKFDKLELPSQMISALEDPLLQKYVVLRDDPSHQRRIEEWLSLFFDAQIQSMRDRDHSPKELETVLSSLLGYVQYTKVLPQSFLNFVLELSNLWLSIRETRQGTPGKESLDTIVELLAMLSLQPFDDLHTKLLSQFDAALVAHTLAYRPPGDRIFATLLNLYTSMFGNWTSALLAHQSPPMEGLNSLSTHASNLVVQILITEPSAIALAAVLRHLSTVAHTISLAPYHPMIRILIPTPTSIYLLAFLSPSVATLSPLCSVLAVYKQAFEATMVTPNQSQDSPGLPPSSPYPRQYVNEFNGFLMDICNLLWRSKAFNTTDQNALGCLIPGQVTRALDAYVDTIRPTPLLLPALFSLSFHPALTALSIAVFREIEDRAIAAADNPDAMDVDSGTGAGVGGSGSGVPGEVRTRHAGPVTQRSLAQLIAEGGVRSTWSEYRMEVLQWLEARGVTGIGELMFCTMKLLMGRRQSQGRPSQGRPSQG